MQFFQCLSRILKQIGAKVLLICSKENKPIIWIVITHQPFVPRIGRPHHVQRNQLHLLLHRYSYKIKVLLKTEEPIIYILTIEHRKVDFQIAMQRMIKHGSIVMVIVSESTPLQSP